MILMFKPEYWFLNAAYDKQVLSKSINLANNIGATHLAFTHFDETFQFYQVMALTFT